MTTQLADLRVEVNNLAEAFSEVEADLSPEVYKMFSKPLGNMVQNMDAAIAQTETISTVMRILALVTKYPHIRIATDRLTQWEQLAELNHGTVSRNEFQPMMEPPRQPQAVPRAWDTFTAGARPGAGRPVVRAEVQLQDFIFTAGEPMQDEEEEDDHE